MQNNIKDENIFVGERIRGLRENFNMSREKFSEMIDVSEVFLGQIERGERSLSIKTLKKIVDYTGFSADFIFPLLCVTKTISFSIVNSPINSMFF